MKLIPIPQYYDKYDSFGNLLEGKSTEINFLGLSKTLNPREILNYEKVFIIAEPGHGKTTLINQIIEILESDKLSYHHIIGINSEIKLLEKHKEKEYIILDALDENKDVIATFIEIQDFCKENNIRLIISNRTHYLSLIHHLLIDDNFIFIRLLPFSDEQIGTFLQQNLNNLKFSDDDIIDILKRSKVNSRNSILAIPRYLNDFSKYILRNKKTSADILKLSKSDLFEQVVYYKLESENRSKRSNSNQKYLTKRVLERLALVMEIHGLNQISKEDFITFLDQTDSNISLIFLNSINLDDLLQRVMKSTDDILQFENSELQEFLAAKELVRLGYRFQIIYDLMIDSQLKLLSPNWIDVLRFAIDLEPEFVRPIITFIRSKNHEAVDEKLIQILIDVRHENFDLEFRDLFFNTIFDYYTAKGKTIHNINEPLAKFVIDSNNVILSPIYKINEIVDTVSHVQSNQILIIEALANLKRLKGEQTALWIDYLIELSKVDKLQSIQMTVFYGLIALGDPDPLLALMEEFEKKPDYILSNYLSTLTKMVPNDIRVIELINKIVKEGRKIDSLEMALNNVKTPESIMSIFKNLTFFVENIRTDLFRYSGGFYTLFETIEVINSKKLDDTIEAFLLRKFENEPYIYNLPKICKESLVYLVRKRPDFLERIISLETFLNSNDEIIRVLAKHLNLKNFKMIEKFLEDHRSSWRLERMISLSKLELENDKKNPIYIYINKNYPVKTPKVLKSSKSIIQKSKLEEFRRFYLDYEDYYSPELIPFLVHNFEELKRQLIESDLKYVKHVLVMILENYNPDNFRIIIDEVSKNRITFSLNQETWFQIELYFNAAYLIGETGLIMQHRDKLLKTLPRIDVSEYQQKDVLQNIIRLIAPITTEDEGIIYNFCINRTDDMLALSSRTLAEVAIHFKLHLLNPVLLMLIENQKIQIFEKEEVLRAFGSLSKGENDYNALKRIVKLRKYDSSLKDIANAALITNYQDRNAIIWRFNELQKRLRPFDMDFRYNGARPVSEFEREMDRPEFPKCFYGIINDLIYNNMLNLLTFSFSVRNDKLKVRYSNYLQQIVYNYFKTFINTKVLADLKKTVSQFPEVSQTYSFNFHMDELIKDFSSQSKKQEPFITAVHSLNHILKKIYLPVNSNAELREIILNVINTDIKNLIENEGFYKLAGEVNEKKVGEVTIQKTLKIALEKALMDRGLRKSDIFREVESYDGLKYDYLISYGLYGPIMVELKLLHNPEIQDDKKRKLYRIKMKKYVGANNKQGIYCIFDIHNKPIHSKKYKMLLNEYKDIENLDIPLLKCYGD